MAGRFRTDRLFLIAVGVCLGAAGAVYYVLEHAAKLNLQVETDRILLAFLAVLMTLLGLSLFLLLLRNLIKLLVERRRKILGSRLRTKLVFIFLVLVLIPSVVLFYAAVNLVQNVNESLFTAPLEELVEGSKAIVDRFNANLRESCARNAARVAGEIAAGGLLDSSRSGELASRTPEWLREGGLDFVELYDRSGSKVLYSAIAPAPRRSRAVPDAELLGQSEEFLRKVAESGQGADRLDRLSSGQRASAVAPIRAPTGGAGGGLVVVGRYISPEIGKRSEIIDEAFKDYRRSQRQRPDIKRVYILLFATLTLLVLFAATWTGFYLARQITVPIQALVEGTQALTAGALDHRVEARAGDEIGFLIDSFNRMAEEMQSSRQAIESSRSQLESSNAELEERRQYIEQLLESVPAGVISLSADGLIETMNRAAYSILGLSAGRPRSGLSPAEAFQGEDLAFLVDEMESLPAAEAVSHVREIQIRVEGRIANLAATFSARRDPAGRYQGALIVLEDLTPVIRSQRTAAWREVARRLAHEIKNPLTPIQLSAQRILKKYQEGSEDYPRIVEDAVVTIVGEVGALKLLVDEFSRFARMPAVAPVPADPNAVVDSALMLYDGIQPGIAFRRELDPSAPKILLDADQIKRALVNLLDNAIAAMEGRGTITLSTRYVPGERVLRIEVADDGPGISAEDKEKLFVPYFSTKKRGTGLGLAIVNRIVSDHNGFIRVEDNRPKGARFVIDLPA